MSFARPTCAFLSPTIDHQESSSHLGIAKVYTTPDVCDAVMRQCGVGFEFFIHRLQIHWGRFAFSDMLQLFVNMPTFNVQRNGYYHAECCQS